jgi:DNA end-binding protein Ku
MGAYRKESQFKMKPIWSGSIQFGLVNIPVGVYSATRSERISFHLLHQKDHARVRNQHICEIEGKVLSNDEIVKGYEYEKGEFVELTDEDFKKVAIKSTRVVEISDFVEYRQIDPVFFDTPYYLVPGKGAAKPYGLLREALASSGKVGIGKVAIRQREYLAAVRPHGSALMLETMHFADEITSSKKLDLPEQDTKVDKRELKVAEQLVEALSSKFEPAKYKDTYREALLELIDQKLKGGTVKGPARAKVAATKVVDIMDKLRQSIQEVKRKSKTTTSGKKKTSKSRAA